MIEKKAEAIMSTKYGDFIIYLFKEIESGIEHIVLSKGEVTTLEPILVRVHSACITGEIFNANNCDCREQIDMAMELISTNLRGLLIYLNQEGRGNGLKAKIESFSLIALKNISPYDAYKELGYVSDNRNFSIVGEILKLLEIKAPIKLLTNNPQKIKELEETGFIISERIDLYIKPQNVQMAAHLKSKINKEGHIYPNEKKI